MCYRKILIFILPVLLLISCSKDDSSSELKAWFTADTLSAKVGEYVTFSDASLGNATRWTWTFEGGTPSTSVLTEPKVQWLDAGTYTVTLKIANKKSSSEITKKKIITIDHNHSITSEFKVDRTVGTDADYLAFTDCSQGYPTEWAWTFRSNTGIRVESSLQNPIMQFTPGVWTVTLVASNPLVSSRKTISNMVTIIADGEVSGDFASPCRITYAGGSIKFEDASIGAGESWSWKFEGGNPSTSTERNPEVTYSSPGIYGVSMTVNSKKNESTTVKDGFVKVIPSEGLVFLLPFDGDISDHGPYSLNPSVQSVGISNTYSDPHPSDEYEGGKSLHFPGGSKALYSVLRMPEAALYEVYPTGSDFTVCCWAKVETLGASNQAIFVQGSCPGVLSEGNNQSWARYQSSGLRFMVESYQGSGNDITTNTMLDDGQWHHLAFVYRTNSSGTRDSMIYVDGVLNMSQNNRPDKQIDTTPYFIGCNLRYSNGAWAPENFLNGDIDDYILYKRALSAEEIEVLANY